MRTFDRRANLYLVWDEGSVQKNKDEINTMIMSSSMPPSGSGGPLSQSAKAVWTAWYEAQKQSASLELDLHRVAQLAPRRRARVESGPRCW